MSPLLEGALLAVCGLVAGFVNTLAGGGSLLTVPILALTGLTWEAANATSRVSVLLQSVSALVGFSRAERMDWREALAMGIPAVLGAAAGAALTWVVAPGLFKPLAVGLLVVVGATMLALPRIAPRAPRTLARAKMAIPLLFVVGVYGGFLQAGVGYLLLAVFSGVLGRDLASGNALKSALVLLFTLVALPLLGLSAAIAWPRGLALGLGSVVGAQLAVAFAVRAKEPVLRLILLGTLVVVVAAAAVT